MEMSMGGLIRCKSLDDIHEEILLSMQEATDLVRCKSVCKSWYSLISSPRFVKSHLKRQQQQQVGDTRITVFNGGTSRDMCRIVGSSDGLVCISRSNHLLVVNPSTGEVKQLVNHPGHDSHVHVFFSGFGYDSSIDDFKVLIAFRDHPNDQLQFYVLELKKNTWREVRLEWDYEYLEGGNGILCNGAIHWLYHHQYQDEDEDEDDIIIASFDLSKEVFQKTPLPKYEYQDDDDDGWILGTMKDRLCVFRRFPNINPEEEEEDFEIWLLRNDDQVSWERKLLLPPPRYDSNNTTIEYNPRIWLLSIDHPHNDTCAHEHIRLSTFSECNYNFDHHVFLKTLVSPHGNASCNKETLKRKRISRDGDGDGDGDGRTVKSRRDSHNSHGGRES